MLLRTPFIASLLALLTAGTATAEELTNIQVAQSGPNLVLTAEASPDLSVDQVVILIRSGVQPPGYIVDGRPAIQFDLAVRDSVVSQFIGKTTRDWEWVPLGPARGSIKDNHYRIEIPIKLIGVGRIHLGVWRIDQGPRKH